MATLPPWVAVTVNDIRPPGRRGAASLAGMEYTPAQRKKIGEDAAGKTVETLEYEDGPGAGYWVMTFTGGSEISFRFMAELAWP